LDDTKEREELLIDMVIQEHDRENIERAWAICAESNLTEYIAKVGKLENQIVSQNINNF
jgi:hypothetical protein